MRTIAVAVLLLGVLPACTGSPSATSKFHSSGTHPPVVPLAQKIFQHMTERERVGQLVMVGVPTTGLTDAVRTAITKYDVGSVILDGTSTAGRSSIATLTAHLQHVAPAHVGLLIATDQEGGNVQRLQGSGFATIPTAVRQGHLKPATLQADWKTWARQLHKAGVDVNLAPVLDTVPKADVASNQPIGALDREYGHTPSAVSSHGLAALKGMAAAHVAATVKHFPGLGRVRGNTDTSRGVKDTVTGPTSSYLDPFRAAVRAGVPFVMISTAIYTRIDADHPAVFSRPVITDLLRSDFGFKGIVISDDLGDAAQVSGYKVSTRAVAFVRAGGDLVLTVAPGQAKAMTAALLAKTKSSPAFKKQVDAAALLVLQQKQKAGLLS